MVAVLLSSAHDSSKSPGSWGCAEIPRDRKFLISAQLLRRSSHSPPGLTEVSWAMSRTSLDGKISTGVLKQLCHHNLLCLGDEEWLDLDDLGGLFQP